MALKNKITIKAKEQKYKSIAEFNVINNKTFYLFNPKNITEFKCGVGLEDDKQVFIHEHLECMWGNDEIDEYVFFDDYKLQDFEDFKLSDVNKVEYDGIEVFYSMSKSFFGRLKYCAVFEIDNNRYYLYIKTIKQERFFSLLKEFFEVQMFKN